MQTQVHALWPGPALLASGTAEHDRPQIELALPGGVGPHPLVLVCPGGGYWTLAAHEGLPVAGLLSSHGIAAAVLRYRHAPHYAHPAPITDACRAIRFLRHNASRFDIDPSRIAVMGFSAGGHLAASVSTGLDGALTSPDDPVDRHPSRPDASILIYPVIAQDDDTAWHRGSLHGLTGEKDGHSPLLRRQFSPYRHVTPRTPPAFLVHSGDDTSVPVANSLLYATALHDAGVPVELHVFPTGGHGYGLAADRPGPTAWPALMIDWLRSMQ